ncbi:MAG: hypothetical protein JO359_00405, partial [Candidatus Eremiobacteraeota bacterium]|nr:hypothetical protein [Candidatus Eremiobacteraeota bacterium]
QATVLPPFPPGPIGIAYWTVAGGAPANGVLFVAANNSIYRIVLNTATTATSVSLFAGTGIAGVLGQGNVNGTGISSQLNFGTSKFVPMVLDYDFNNAAPPAPAKNLYFCDTGNGLLKKISLSGSNTVSTVVSASRCAGLAYDVNNGMLYLTNSDNTIAQVNPTTGTASPFAGSSGVSGGSNGLGQVAYPVQFNVGNAMTSSAGGALAPQFAGGCCGFVGANSNAAAQAAAGVSSFVARFNNPIGITYDTFKKYFYSVDNGSAAVRVSL